MDQLRHLDRDDVNSTDTSSEPAIGFGSGDEYLVQESRNHLAIDPALFALSELEALYESDKQTLWTFMRPTGRPSFTPALLHDFEDWQRLITSSFGPGKVPLRYLVLGSRSKDIFCFGGDLGLFSKLIEQGDRDSLVRYGHRCVEILHRNCQALDLPLITIGLAQGDALGGGFEALLSFDYIIAEKTARFGLPETMFGLFPGMGAHSILSRKLGTAMADRLITSNENYSAQEMYDLGIVHQVVEPGEGITATRDFIKKADRRHIGLVNARKAMRMARPLELEEMRRITELWADTALQLSPSDLKVMGRLTKAQDKLITKA
ncbi:crotonase/enoyl-CoA hydratase family protein [Altericroceibacterium endophyticum]|uniref:Enoyl-CoA hydratase n=1 Tax=Altericroceibacterium endophyticum TaxID=1808508 RepID=A0A6I4T7R0_9SPHN|nr:crotonase/enoyl-CoA hydratase family protein [Altericroceibacterium endophyticum]MXO66023.1 enoyl-CoA hydratase [Altericroceibacterium endophyticum]